jgi:hypothetical protein
MVCLKDSDGRIVCDELKWIGFYPDLKRRRRKKHTTPVPRPIIAIPGLINTGLDVNGVPTLTVPPLTGNRTPDPHYTTTLSAGVSVSTPAIRISPLNGTFRNHVLSSWISPGPLVSNTLRPPGTYQVHTNLNLTNFDPTTVILRIILLCTSPNVLITLNGNEEFLVENITVTVWSPEFIISNGFVDGINSLQLTWEHTQISTRRASVIRLEMTGTGSLI